MKLAQLYSISAGAGAIAMAALMTLSGCDNDPVPVEGIVHCPDKKCFIDTLACTEDKVARETMSYSGSVELYRYYQYDENDRLFKYAQLGPQKTIVLFQHFTFDDEGRPLATFMTGYRPWGTELSEFQYFYNSAGLISSQKSYWGGYPNATLSYTYDGQNRLIEEVYNTYDVDNYSDWGESYEYNSDGTLLTRVSWAHLQYDRYEYEYENQLKTKESIYAYDVFQSYVLYRYANGFLRESREYNKDNIRVDSTIMIRNAAGGILERRSYNQDDIETNNTIQTFSPTGKLLHAISSHGGQPYDEKTYEYDSKDRQIKSIEVNTTTTYKYCN